MRSLLLLLALVAMGAVHAQEVPPTRPQVKVDTRGGHFLESTVAHAYIDGDKTYAEMTPEERQFVRNHYEGLGPDDEPPYPKYGTRLIFELINAEMRKSGIEGDVTIGIIVGADGKAKGVNIYETPDRHFGRVVAGILAREPYKPGLCAGMPCDMEFPFRFRFDLSVMPKHKKR